MCSVIDDSAFAVRARLFLVYAALTMVALYLGDHARESVGLLNYFQQKGRGGF